MNHNFHTFRVGDVVRVRGHARLLTVVRDCGNPDWLECWSDHHGRVFIPVAVLVLVPVAVVEEFERRVASASILLDQEVER